MATALLSRPARGIPRDIDIRVPWAAPAQWAAWRSKKRYVLLRGGIRGGKTFTGAIWTLTREPKTSTIIAAPTYKVLEGGAMATLMPMLESGGLIVRKNMNKGDIELFDGRKLFLRSMERPQNTRGITANYVWFDEPGIVGSRDAHDVLIGRMSAEPAQMLETTTPPPDGDQSWLYKIYVTDYEPTLHDHFLLRTEENLTLRRGYVSELRREYADAYALRELDAEWINVGTIHVYDVDKIRIVEHAPAVKLVRLARGWDTAATGGGGDYTAGVKIAIDEKGHLWILDVVRGQWAPAERNAMLLKTAQADGREGEQRIAKARGDAGISQAHEWIRLLAGYRVTTEYETGDKVVRAGALAAQIGIGNVTIACAPGSWENYWHDGKRLAPAAARARFLSNLGLFPRVRAKDESDAGYQGLMGVTQHDTGITVGGYSG